MTPPAPSRMDRERLSLVAEIVAAVPHPGSRPAFHDRLLGALFRTLDVRRAFLALRDPADGTLRRMASRTSEHPPEGGEIRVSGTVLARSLEEGLSQRLDDALADPDLSGSESVRRLGIRSVLCVPVPIRGRPEGVLYADNRARKASFTKEDLEFLEMIGRLTGVVLENLDHMEALDRENERLRAVLREGIEMVATAPAMEPVLRKARLAAPTDATVLLTGESGTGKELLASAIHRLSGRKEGPLVAVNCAAIPETLLEAELFGIAPRSGIAGAPAEGREGKFERAGGGTLFLDEIGEVPLATQVKLLRVLEASTFRHVGGTRELKVDVRVLAATHRDLDRQVAEGKFREDLLYRLDTVRIEVPPLRRRREDLPQLIEHFMIQLGGKAGLKRRIDPGALSLLERHAWPGNIRELLNVVEHALVVSDDVIGPEHLPRSVRRPEGNGGGLLARTAPEDGALPTLRDLEHAHVVRVLEEVGGHRSKAARILGISERNLYRKLREYGLS